VIASQIGKATKLSRFGRGSINREIGVRKSAEIVALYGLNFHVLDAEWLHTDISINELQNLLSFRERFAINPFMILTISTRRDDASLRLGEALRVINKYANCGLCLVAGNKRYLNESEQRKPAVKTLQKFVKSAREKTQKTIFIGSEGLVREAAKLAKEYDLIPFLLLNQNLEEDLKVTWEITGGMPTAVYAPTYFAERKADDDVIKHLLGYLLRRRWVCERLAEKGYLSEAQALLNEGFKDSANQHLKRLLGELADRFSINGDVERMKSRIQQLKSLGVNILVALPIIEGAEQVRLFTLCAKNSSRWLWNDEDYNKDDLDFHIWRLSLPGIY